MMEPKAQYTMDQMNSLGMSLGEIKRILIPERLAQELSQAKKVILTLIRRAGIS